MENIKITKEDLLSFEDVIKMIGFGSRPTFLRWRKKGTFPEPKKFGQRVRFLKSDIEKWIVENCK